MFSKNINALKTNNPKLAEKIEKISLEAAANIISVLQAASGDLVIAYNDQPLEDTLNPLQKAKEIWETTVKQPLGKSDIVVVFGLGLGYLFKRAYVNCVSRIALYEPNIEVLRFVLEYVDFASEISDNRVFISDSEEEILNYLAEKYISNDKIEVLFSNNYVNLFSNKLLSLSENIVTLCETKNVDVVTIMHHSMHWVINSMLNARFFDQSRSVAFFKDKFAGKTALIAAAGPSLRKDINIIKANRDKYVIFAVNKILDYLIENGIEPDFLVASDARLVGNTIKVRPDVFPGINLIATSKTDSFVFEQDFNSKIMYFLANDSVFEELRKRYPEEIKGYETEGTSVSQCYYTAVEMGFKNIIFAGLDLAIKPDTPYATDIKIQIDNDGKALIAGEKRDLVPVKSVTGESVLTRQDYYIFVKQFSRAFCEDNSVVKYNCSDFGAYIEGMIYKPLEEIIPDISSVSMDVNSVIKKVYSETENKWLEISGSQKEIFAKQREDMVEIKELVIEWKKKYFEKLTEWIVKREQSQDLGDSSSKSVFVEQPAECDGIRTEDELIKIKNEEINIIKRITTNDLLASFLQEELLEFVKLNQDSSKFLEARKYSLKILGEEAFLSKIIFLVTMFDPIL